MSQEKQPLLKEFQKAALLNTVFSLFFNLLPFWAGLLLVLSSELKIDDWSRFYKSGEFYLYSSSLLASAYLIYHNNKVRRADLGSLFSIVSLILIVLTSILYAFIASGKPPLNGFIKWASIVSIFLSLPLFFYSQIVANKPSPDVSEQRHNEQETIMKGIN